MAYHNKKFINDPNDVVTEFIEGLVETYPGLQYLDGFPQDKVVLRFDVSGLTYDKVSVISGGGSGHEPAHAGFVGEGMLTAAICGDVFASPPSDSILAGIRAVTGPSGCLLIVKNYTSDRLHFGLASELAKSEGYKVEMVIVGDDCGLPPQRCTDGRRGLAGIILVHKIAGAAAACGLSLAEVAAEAKQASEMVGTMGVALSICTLPGQETPHRLDPGKMELGLGIHGEPGAGVADLQPVDLVVSLVLKQILSKETNYVSITRGSRVVLMINGLGATPLMELMIAAKNAVSGLQLEHGLAVERVYTGSFMTSLDMSGLSITLLKADEKILSRLDAPTNAPNWPVGTDGNRSSAKILVPLPSSRTQKNDEDVTPETIEEEVDMYETAVKWLKKRNISRIPLPDPCDKNNIELVVIALERLKESYDVDGQLNDVQKEDLALIEHAIKAPDEALSLFNHILQDYKEDGIGFVDRFRYSSPDDNYHRYEKFIDAYLDQYLWHMGRERGLFPNWIQPHDSEEPPRLVYNWCQGINRLEGIWDTHHEQGIMILETKFENLIQNINLTTLNKLLRLVVEDKIADYFTDKNSFRVSDKNICFSNNLGLENDLQFSSFFVEYYALILDIMLLGLTRAGEIAGTPEDPNLFVTFHNPTVETGNPIRLYCRFIDKVHILIRFAFWKDSTLPNRGRNILRSLKKRLPISTLKWKNSNVSIYSEDHPFLRFTMCGFVVNMCPESRLIEVPTAGLWSLCNKKTKERAIALLEVDVEQINVFEKRVNRILSSLGPTTLTKIVDEWNNSLLGFMSYFREATLWKKCLLVLLSGYENKLRTYIITRLNPVIHSLPPVIFYAPKELGGLGILSMGGILIPEGDRIRYGKQIDVGLTQVTSGMSHEEDHRIPNLYSYIKHDWFKYFLKMSEAARQSTSKDLEDESLLLCEYGRGVRQYFKKKYEDLEQDPSCWVHQKQDVALWNLNEYWMHVIKAMGGVEAILEHSLFKATYFPTWDDLSWENVPNFEENERFTFWWSPTINRGILYHDPIGISMQDRRSPLVKIFRANLWKAIHKEVLDVLQKILEEKLGPFVLVDSDDGTKFLLSDGRWPMSKPSLLAESKDIFDQRGDEYWICLRLRWGAYDSHDIEHYTREKFMDYTLNSTGVVIGLDLTYNCYSAFGSWVDGLKLLISHAMTTILKSNPQLCSLRKRIIKKLRLHEVGEGGTVK